MGVTHEIKQLQGLWNQLKQQKGLATSSTSTATFLSRLQCMQDAMLVHLERLKKHFPNRRVAILAFDDRIECYFGGVAASTMLRQEDIPSLQKGIDHGSRLAPRGFTTIKDSYEDLERRTKGLAVRGATAAGSALALAIGLVKAHKAISSSPSEIFLCTDGASNSGIGNTSSGSESALHGRPFYSEAGETAAGLGAKVNVIGIQGEGVALDVLSVVAQSSGGLLNVVDVNELRRELRTATQKRVVAQDISILVHLPRGFTFQPDPRPTTTILNDGRTVKLAQPQADDKTFLTLAFGYTGGAGEKRRTWPDGADVPVQASITYTVPQNKEVRVRTLHKAVPTTADRAAAETGAHVSVVATHVLQHIGTKLSVLFAEGSRSWAQTQRASAAARDMLFAANKMLGRGAVQALQQEEATGFAGESASLDELLARVFGEGKAYPVGWARDDAVRSLAKYSGVSREVVASGEHRKAKVLRAAALI